MRTLILASATLLTALAVLMAVSASHKRAAVTQSQPMEQAQTQPTPVDGVRRVTVEELRTALEKGAAIVIDVRGDDAYKAGHIKGAISIPGDKIAERAKELPKDKLIVLYCS